MKLFKNITTVFVFSLILMGCSLSEEKTLEQKIMNLMSSKDINYGRVIDYDIKENFIVVIYKSKTMEQLYVGFIKVDNKGELEWEIGMGGPDLAGGYVFICDPMFVNVIIPKEPDVHDVKVLGESAKLVKYSDEIKYWISFTDKCPNSFDVEYIKK